MKGVNLGVLNKGAYETFLSCLEMVCTWKSYDLIISFFAFSLVSKLIFSILVNLLSADWFLFELVKVLFGILHLQMVF
jgi:hypothetical protein